MDGRLIVEIHELINEAHKLFDSMPKRVVVTWNITINGYVKNEYR